MYINSCYALGVQVNVSLSCAMRYFLWKFDSADQIGDGFEEGWISTFMAIMAKTSVLLGIIRCNILSSLLNQ